MNSTTILWFTEEACRDVRLAGGKGASLAKMNAEGLPVPPGFVIAAHVLEQAVDADRVRELVQVENHKEAKELVSRAMPPREVILAGFNRLGGKVGVGCASWAEDSGEASYGG